MACVLAAAASTDDITSVDVARCPQQTHFLCRDSSACIPHTWLCDLADDCNDFSDEGPAAGCSGEVDEGPAAGCSGEVDEGPAAGCSGEVVS